MLNGFVTFTYAKCFVAWCLFLAERSRGPCEYKEREGRFPWETTHDKKGTRNIVLQQNSCSTAEWGSGKTCFFAARILYRLCYRCGTSFWSVGETISRTSSLEKKPSIPAASRDCWRQSLDDRLRMSIKLPAKPYHPYQTSHRIETRNEILGTMRIREK